MTNLMQAATQWASRPADERYASITEMYDTAREKRRTSQETEAFPAERLQVVPREDNGLALAINDEVVGTPSNWAFRQLCARLSYPAAAIIDSDGPRLTSELAADVLNYRISQSKEIPVSLLRHNDTIRSINGGKYARIWDADIVAQLRNLENNGWRVPPARPVSDTQPGCRPATEEDVISMNALNMGGLAVRVGDMIAPAGLYMGDRDMFAFLIDGDTDRHIDDGGGNALMRGLMIWNSEVGASSFGITRFVCQAVCGNHIVWGASEVTEVKYRHIGKARERIYQILSQGIEPEGSLEPVLTLIDRMRRETIGADRDSVIDAVYRFRLDNCLTQKNLREAYTISEEFRNVDGDPNSWYGVANGLTRYSQTLSNADERVSIDRAAGRLYAKAQEVLA